MIDAPAQRTTALVDEPLSEDGGAVLRNLGARLFVMPVSIYDDLPNTLGGFTDTTQLVQIQVAPDITVNAAIVDRLAAPALSRNTTTPTLTAIQQVADLLAARQQVQDQGGDPRRHGMLLGTENLGLPRSTASARSPPCSPPHRACAPPPSTTWACAPTNCSAAKVRWW